MFIKQLDNFVRQAVSASRIQVEDRRLGEERRQAQSARWEQERRAGEERRELGHLFAMN